MHPGHSYDLTRWNRVIVTKQIQGCTKGREHRASDYAPFCRNGSKTKQVMLCCHSSELGGNKVISCQEFPAQTPERPCRSSSETDRLINVPLTALGLKGKIYTIMTQHWMTARARVCSEASSSAEYGLISTQPPVYMKGVNKHHMNSNKAHPQSTHASSWRGYSTAHCNLNPLFESSVCMCVCVCGVEGRRQGKRLKLTVFSCLRGKVRRKVKTVGL